MHSAWSGHSQWRPSGQSRANREKTTTRERQGPSFWSGLAECASLFPNLIPEYSYPPFHFRFRAQPFAGSLLVRRPTVGRAAGSPPWTKVGRSKHEGEFPAPSLSGRSTLFVKYSHSLAGLRGGDFFYFYFFCSSQLGWSGKGQDVA